MVCKDNEGKNSARGSTALYLHTLETLCKELISGRTVGVEDGGDQFAIESREGQAILNWYWNNRTKWAQRNKKEDVEKIVDAIQKDPSRFPEPILSCTVGL